MGAITIQPGATYTRREPARAANLESDVGVPALQALISGGFAGLAGGTVAGVAGWDALLIGAATGALCASVVWATLVSDHSKLLWRIEEIIGADLNRDSAVGEPAPAGEQLVLVHGAGRAQQQAQESALRRRFEEFVRGCEVHGTSQNYWEQVHRLSREDYVGWRDTLIRLGWAHWRGNNPNQGWELTAQADEVIAGMFRELPHPTQRCA
jgi:hypothetical protein